MVVSGLAAWLLPLRKKKVRNHEFKFKQCSGAVPMDKNITVKLVYGFSVVPRNELYTGFISGSAYRAHTIKDEHPSGFDHAPPKKMNSGFTAWLLTWLKFRTRPRAC